MRRIRLVRFSVGPSVLPFVLWALLLVPAGVFGAAGGAAASFYDLKVPSLEGETVDLARGFSVLGFPSNDFGGQEPGTSKEIRKFCSLKYDVTFPMFDKVVTRPGPTQSPAYAFLGRSRNLPGWNFAKYVVGRDGQVVAFFPSQVNPESPELRAAIEMALAASPR